MKYTLLRLIQRQGREMEYIDVINTNISWKEVVKITGTVKTTWKIELGCVLSHFGYDGSFTVVRTK